MSDLKQLTAKRYTIEQAVEEYNQGKLNDAEFLELRNELGVGEGKQMVNGMFSDEYLRRVGLKRNPDQKVVTAKAKKVNKKTAKKQPAKKSVAKTTVAGAPRNKEKKVTSEPFKKQTAKN